MTKTANKKSEKFKMFSGAEFCGENDLDLKKSHLQKKYKELLPTFANFRQLSSAVLFYI